MVERSMPGGTRRLWHPSIDVYAAGIVLYSCVTGRAPYDHLGEDTEDVAKLLELKTEEGLCNLAPYDYAALVSAPGVSELAGELNGLLSLCLHPRPDQRPTAREAREFLEDLVGWLGSQDARPRSGRLIKRRP